MVIEVLASSCEVESSYLSCDESRSESPVESGCVDPFEKTLILQILVNLLKMFWKESWREHRRLVS